MSIAYEICISCQLTDERDLSRKQMLSKKENTLFYMYLDQNFINTISLS